MEYCRLVNGDMTAFQGPTARSSNPFGRNLSIFNRNVLGFLCRNVCVVSTESNPLSFGMKASVLATQIQNDNTFVAMHLYIIILPNHAVALKVLNADARQERQAYNHTMLLFARDA